MKVALLLLAFVPIPDVSLSPKTVKEFNAYMEVADRSMNSRALGSTRLSLPATGEPLTAPWTSDDPYKVTDGLIHDWIAAAFIPKATVKDVVAVLQDYAHYKEIYQPDLMDLRLIGQNGEKRQLRMRTIKKKIVTVILDIDYDVEFRTIPNGRVQVWSRSTAIREVDHAGEPNETRSPPDKNAGLLWGLNTYWQLENRAGGVYMECRAISLTRDIPMLAVFAVKPMVTALPRESLSKTLEATRAAVEARLRS